MNVFTVSFFGHRRISDFFAVENVLENYIRALLHTHDFVEFLVGRDGDFDQMVSSAVLRCKRSYGSDNSALVCVFPYLKSELRDNEEAYRNYYDEIEICEASAAAHFKAAHQIRNRSMIDRSDFVIFCVERRSGGAYQSLQYAREKGVQYINLCERVQ